MTPPEPAENASKFARQKRTVTIIAVLLIVAGLVLLFLLKRLPLPMRLMAGLTDLFGGLVLLVLVRQHK
jgi:hypothetical protein